MVTYKESFNIKTEYLLILFLILMVLPFLILNYFNHPAPEDFYWAEETKKLGFIKAFRGWYKFEGGRYITFALANLNPLVFNSMVGYRVHTFLLMLTFFYVLFLFVFEITKSSLAFKESVLLSLSIIFLYLYGMASVREGFYWEVAAIQYHFSFVLIMLFSIFYIRLSNENNFTKRIFYIIISCLIVLIIPGTNELSATMISILIISLIIKNFLIEKKFNWLLVVFAILIGIGVYVAFSAPGNFKRMGPSSVRGDFIYSVYNSVTFLIEKLLLWAFNTPLLVITLLFIPTFFKIIKQRAGNEDMFSINPIYSLMLCFLLLFAITYGINWSQGGFPYDRTLNFLYLVFLIEWFYILIALCIYIDKKFNISVEKLPKYVYTIAFIIIVLFLFKENNIQTAYTDLFGGAAYKYHTALNERYNFILQSTSDSIEVDSIKNVPKSFYSLELIDDNELFLKAFAQYFHKKSIVKKSKDKLE